MPAADEQRLVAEVARTCSDEALLVGCSRWLSGLTLGRMSEQPERKLTPAVWLATGFGVGLVSPAPGTVGALWGLPWAWWLTSGHAPAWAWVTVPVGILLGITFCTRAAKDLGGEKDPGAIVWDEIATVPLVFALWPSVGWFELLIGFGLHRLFDITKPPPCRRLEKLPDGLGVMMDDVAAAAYAMGVMGLLHLLAASFVT